MGRIKTVLFKTTEELLEGYGLKPANALGENGERQIRYVSLRGKKIESGNVSLYLNRQENGKQIKRYLSRSVLCLETDATVKARNKETLRQARVIADEADAAVQKEINGFSIAKKATVNLISYILYQAEEALSRSGNKHGYYYTLQSLAKHISLYSGEKTTLVQVDKNYILGFISYLKTAKNFNYQRTKSERDREVLLTPNTQHNLFMKFKYVLRKAVKEDVISVNPADKLENSEKPQEEEGTREFLIIDEIKKLIATPCKNSILKSAFLFCCLVGLRYSDVSSITWGELVKDSEGAYLLRFKMKKVKRGEYAYISDEALKWLPEREDAADSDIIYPLPKNDSANKQLARWIKTAGIMKRITFHCSRHTAATLNLSLGTSIEIVSKMMGHTKISTTQIYAKIIDESRKAAVSKQNGIFD